MRIRFQFAGYDFLKFKAGYILFNNFGLIINNFILKLIENNNKKYLCAKKKTY